MQKALSKENEKREGEQGFLLLPLYCLEEGTFWTFHQFSFSGGLTLKCKLNFEQWQQWLWYMVLSGMFNQQKASIGSKGMKGENRSAYLAKIVSLKSFASAMASLAKEIKNDQVTHPSLASFCSNSNLLN